MTRLKRLLFAALLAAAVATPAYAEKVDTIATRPGVTVKAIVRGDATGNPPVVILFMGGNGVVHLDDWNGHGNPVNNFLVRTRKHFARNGLLAVVPDAPSDHQGDGLTEWRTSADHAADVAALIRHMRAYSKGPVFLVGTSRGTISAAGVAAQLPAGTIAGIVLTSSVTRYPRGGGKQRVADAKLEDIRVPVLFVHHKEDACDVCVPEDIPDLARKFVHTPSVKIEMVEGGGNYRGSECGALSAHGYRGIERRVVDDIAAWIKTVAAGTEPRI